MARIAGADMTTLTDVTPAQIIHSDAAAHEFDAIQLLRLCHTYLRGAEINLPGGCRPLDRDKLARQINQFLNEKNAVQPPEVHMGQGS